MRSRSTKITIFFNIFLTPYPRLSNIFEQTELLTPPLISIICLKILIFSTPPPARFIFVIGNFDFLSHFVCFWTFDSTPPEKHTFWIFWVFEFLMKKQGSQPPHQPALEHRRKAKYLYSGLKASSHTKICCFSVALLARGRYFTRRRAAPGGLPSCKIASSCPQSNRKTQNSSVSSPKQHELLHACVLSGY